MKKIYQKWGLSLVMAMIVSSQLFAQSLRVNGKITDEAGQGVPGASILEKGTTNGTVSDANGDYALNVAGSNAVLVISFIGYKAQEIALGGRSTIDVKLEQDVTSLQEVVVVGYSSVEKKDLSTSVSIVDTKEMAKVASANIGDQLVGRVAGVQVNTSGDPGGSQSIRIRGIGTINNNEPLYVIDGVPVQSEANFNFLNPNDIESIQVLKDAAAASIYGSRAANGVIVVTTKKGKGASKIDVQFYTGTQDPARYPSMANPTELLQIRQGLAAGAGQNFTSPLYPQVGNSFVLPDYMTRNGGFLAGDAAVDPSKYYLNSDPNADSGLNNLIQKTNKAGTNWFKELFKPAAMTSFQISGSGGSEKGNYYWSANYYDHNGIVTQNYYKRYQTRLNSSFNVAKRVRVGENVNFAYQTTQGSIGNPNEGSPIKNAYAMPQIIPVYDINGYWGSPAGVPSNASNPIAQQYRAADGNKGHTIRMLGNVFAELDFLKYFTARTTFGLDYFYGPSQSYGYRNFEATEINSSNSYSESSFNNRNWVFTNTINFNRNIGNHTISALVGQEARDVFYQGYSAGGNKLTFGDDPYFRTLNNTTPGTYFVSSYFGETKFSSLFFNVNYNYADKYYFTGTVRRDGSSRFINNKYGTFPAASVAWRISKESFMADVSVINDLKLRASYGVTGNNSTGSDYPGFTNYSTDPGTTNYDINGTGNSLRQGFSQASTGNPNLKWETTYLTNIGIDATIFKKFDLTLEWYDRETKDMIYDVKQPAEAGKIGVISQNIGSMSNKGIDFQINYRGSALNNELKFTVGLNGTQYTNKVVSIDANSNTAVYGDGTRIGNPTVTEPGQAISHFRGYMVDGLWTSQSQLDAVLFADKGDAKVGRFKFVDVNKDGKIDDNDIVNTGSPIPTIQLGLNLTATYKNFDVTAFFTGKYGNKLFNFVKYFTQMPAFQGNYSKDMLYNAGKTLPVLDQNDNYSSRLSNFYLEDGSFTRLRNLIVGYTLPQSISKKYGMEKFRIYVQGQNLFTITNYSGLDPDVVLANTTDGGTARRDLSIGLDNGRYPWARTFIIGLNVTF
jgi:TonB-linked SusC/RagA family outer membrane protein